MIATAMMAAAAVLLMKMVKKHWMLIGQEGLRTILRLMNE
jgi:hypothetical protein